MLPIGLTPTEMAMRINEKSVDIKKALSKRKRQLEVGNVDVVKKETVTQNSERPLEKNNPFSKRKDNTVSAQRLPTARRGSVQWDNMDESTTVVKSRDKEGYFMSTVADQKQLSKWVPIEFCEIAFIPGIPSANKRLERIKKQ